jgi:5'-nucleotidase
MASAGSMAPSSTLGGMKLLVTNDDGVSSPGLQALVRALSEAGLDVRVVAPSRDMSGTSASIGGLHADTHIDAQPVELPGAEQVPAYAVDGPPGLCVLAAWLGGFGDPPDLVVSGINAGGNTGRAVLHSGTVGAALTAANFGGRGLAVSLDITTPWTTPGADLQVGRAAPRDDGVTVRHWDSAAAVATAAVEWLASAEVGTVLNVNVPDRPLAELHGARWGNLATLGTVRSSVVEPATERGKLQLELRPSGAELPPDSDTAIVQAGYVAVTTITGVRATASIDVEPVVGAAFDASRRKETA